MTISFPYHFLLLRSIKNKSETYWLSSNGEPLWREQCTVHKLWIHWNIDTVEVSFCWRNRRRLGADLLIKDRGPYGELFQRFIPGTCPILWSIKFVGVVNAVRAHWNEEEKHCAAQNSQICYSKANSQDSGKPGRWSMVYIGFVEKRLLEIGVLVRLWFDLRDSFPSL